MKVKNIHRIKLAVLIGQIWKLGGVGIAAVQEVRELRKIGIDAELVVLFRREGFDYRDTHHTDDIPVIFLSDSLPELLRINFKIPFFSFFSFFHLTSVLWAPSLIKKRVYDVILVHETYNCFSAIASAKKAKAKLFAYVWDPISYIVPRIYGKKIPGFLLPLAKYISRVLDKYILRNCDVVLTGSSLHKDLFHSLNPNLNLITIPAGTRILSKLPPKRDRVIISLTKWDMGKNPEFLLEIAKKLKSEYQMKIAGNWMDLGQKKNFESKIKRYNLDRRIKLLGMVSEDEKMKLFSEARVLVHPIVEAFGMFALEAAACGCPIILPKNSGVCELFIEGEHGYFPKEGDVESFAKWVNMFLEDDKKALEMGKAAWEVAKKYTWKEHARKIVEAIERGQ